MLKGKEYRLLFTLNALDEIQTKFGGYDKINKAFNQNNPDWVKDTKWLLTLLINEGLLEEDENAELLDEKKVGRLIHVGNLKEVQQETMRAPKKQEKTKRKAQRRGKREPGRKIRYCPAFVYCNGTPGIQGV